MPLRIFLTLVALGIDGFFNLGWNTASTLYSAKAAGSQFQNSDVAWVSSQAQMAFWRGAGVSSLILLLVLLAIWWKPLRKFFIAATTPMLILLAPPPAHAYFDTTDVAEAYTILPNESAFWIPDVGNRNDDQTRMDSEAFVEQSRVAVTRFIIPHAKFQGSGGNSVFSGWDKYVPSGRLIIVDRTPFTREWVDDLDRGTSSKKEGFICQSKEGLDITVGISIGTSVPEGPMASKFLYNFGVHRPDGKRNDPNVIFTSVYFGRSLAEVMDDNARKEIQTLVCRELTARTLDEDNLHANEIMKIIETEARAYLARVGITLNFIGWAHTFTFSPAVQKAIDDRYVADKLAPVAALLQSLAILKVQEGLSRGLETKGLPIVVTPGMIEALTNLIAKPEVK